MRLEAEVFHEVEVLATVHTRGGEHVVGDGGVRSALKGSLAVIAQYAAPAREADVCLRVDESVYRHDAAELVVCEFREVLVTHKVLVIDYLDLME